MITAKDRLKFKTRKVFVEADPPADRSRPLEWRRAVNSFDVEVKTFTIKHHQNVTKTVFNFHSEDPDLEVDTPLIKPDLRSRRTISSIINAEDMRDTIYRAVEQEKDEKIYTLAGAKDPLELILSDQEPIEKDTQILGAGIHYGHIWFDEEDGFLKINASVPKDVLSLLIDQIQERKIAKIQIRIALDSFTYEVDDALREWYHPRNLVIENKMSVAAIESFTVVGQDYTSYMQTLQADAPGMAHEQTQSPISTNITTLLDPKNLNSIKTALWAIAAVLAFIWLGGKG